MSFVIAISQEWKLLALQATQSRHPISTVDVNKCVRSMCCGRKKMSKHEDCFCENILNLDQWLKGISYLELWQLFCSDVAELVRLW